MRQAIQAYWDILLIGPELKNAEQLIAHVKTVPDVCRAIDFKVIRSADDDDTDALRLLRGHRLLQ